MKTRFRVPVMAVTSFIAAILGGFQPAPAQPADSDGATTGSTGETPPPTSQPAMPSLIQKLPNYLGDWSSREHLTGDWGGERTRLAEQGILFDLDVTQVTQGNAHGGKSTNNAFRYSGSVDYRFKLDTARMGLWPGGLLTLHGETKIGDNINPKVGSLGAPNFQGLLPVPDEPGTTTLSEFYFMQALSEQFVLLAGKVDGTSLVDQNAFAGNQRTQFMNVGLRVNPVLFCATPYTTMAAGAVWLPTKWLQVVTAVTDNDPDGAATKTGFNTAFHGRDWTTVVQEFEFKLKLFDKPGHQRFGWFWTSRDFIDFGGDPRLPLPGRVQNLGLLPRRIGRLPSLPKPPRWLRSIRLGDTVLSADGPSKRPDDWGLYYNFDQYLYTEPGDSTQGFGLFGRFGWSTGESNPIEEFYSIGLGGKGSIPHRDRDTWGLGYYALNMSDDLPPALGVDAEHGAELFYSVEVTPWLHITPSLQVIVDPGAGFQDRDVAVVYGLRAQMSF